MITAKDLPMFAKFTLVYMVVNIWQTYGILITYQLKDQFTNDPMAWRLYIIAVMPLPIMIVLAYCVYLLVVSPKQKSTESTESTEEETP